MSADQQQQGEAPGAPPQTGLEKKKEPKPGSDATSVGFYTGPAFELLQRIARMFAESTLVPEVYRGNVGNCAIGINIASRIGADPLMVLQNLYVVHGRPGWSAVFLIATFNQCGRFTAVKYEWKGERGTPEYGCRAWAKEKGTGERIEGVWIDWKLVKAEGWDAKNGSKWKTMPDQMFVYRAAAWMIKANAPEIAMGLQTAEELEDVIDLAETEPGVFTLPPESEIVDPPKSATDALASKLKVNGGAQQTTPPAQTREPGDDEDEPQTGSSLFPDPAASRVKQQFAAANWVEALDKSEQWDLSPSKRKPLMEALRNLLTADPEFDQSTLEQLAADCGVQGGVVYATASEAEAVTKKLQGLIAAKKPGEKGGKKKGI